MTAREVRRERNVQFWRRASPLASVQRNARRARHRQVSVNLQSSFLILLAERNEKVRKKPKLVLVRATKTIVVAEASLLVRTFIVGQLLWAVSD